MFKTIFGKLVTIFVSILLFSFLITGVTLYFFLGDFVANKKVEALAQSGEIINQFFNAYSTNLDNPVVMSLFTDILQWQSASTNSMIWIVNTEGGIVFPYPEIDKIDTKISSKLDRKEDGYYLSDASQYRKVMLGQADPVKEIGDFYGLFKDTGTSWLTIQKPLKMTISGKEEIVAAVFLNTAIPEVYQVRESVFRMFLISVFISILFSIILIYVFSRKITKPLKEIRNAAKTISSGEFQNRLDIRSKDEIGELALSFNNMAANLQNLEEMRRGFIANVSHELRTPMTSIKGFIQGILDDVIPPDKHSYYLTIVKDEISRLNRLVNDLLDLAKMEAGEIKLNKTPININEMIRRCIIKLEGMIISKGLEIHAEFEDDDIYVSADPDAIERVIINLIHNAVKFTPYEGIIKVSTKVQKNKVFVSIEDNGVGIDENDITHIWDRFYKSDKSRGEDKTGTGLGLSIVKNIINEHKQEIWIESEPGKGTSFTFTLDKIED